MLSSSCKVFQPTIILWWSWFCTTFLWNLGHCLFLVEVVHYQNSFASLHLSLLDDLPKGNNQDCSLYKERFTFHLCPYIIPWIWSSQLLCQSRARWSEAVTSLEPWASNGYWKMGISGWIWGMASWPMPMSCCRPEAARDVCWHCCEPPGLHGFSHSVSITEYSLCTRQCEMVVGIKMNKTKSLFSGFMPVEENL